MTTLVNYSSGVSTSEECNTFDLNLMAAERKEYAFGCNIIAKRFKCIESNINLYS